MTYIVSFTIINAPKFTVTDRVSSVKLTEGYSDFEDIRKILSMPLGLKPENILVKAAMLKD